VVEAVAIGSRLVGPGEPCFVIAEVGVNHNGDVDLAVRLVDAAADAGADAVKLQTFITASLVTEDAPKAGYQLETTGEAESQHAMLRALELSADGHRRVLERCRERGILLLSTPFDEESVKLLVELGIPALKVASPEITNHPFLQVLARQGLPLLLSTGMSTLDEVAAAVDVVRAAGGDQLVVLHCVSAYPAPLEEANVRAMIALERFGAPVGYSDHTTGEESALAAVALGAAVLEKHLTLDRTLPGPDHQASLEPDEFGAFVRRVRRVEAALGDGVKKPSPSEAVNRDTVRRSLVAAEDLPVGTLLEPAMLAALRPGTGIPPSELPSVVGRRLARPVTRGALLGRDDLA
jgi:N,N'-diacetyllegionaminate synthase